MRLISKKGWRNQNQQYRSLKKISPKRVTKTKVEENMTRSKAMANQSNKMKVEMENPII